MSLNQRFNMSQPFGADFFNGVKTAYNLDGGGLSTLYFNGQVINKPTTGGNTISERAVSDIVYIGY